MTNDTEEIILDECIEENDLGVWTSSNMKPSLQCSKAAATAVFVLKSIKRSFPYLDTESFNIVYKTYVRSHLEDCIQAWSACLVKDIQLEKVQRLATQLVSRIK